MLTTVKPTQSIWDTDYLISGFYLGHTFIPVTPNNGLVEVISCPKYRYRIRRLNTRLPGQVLYASNNLLLELTHTIPENLEKILFTNGIQHLIVVRVPEIQVSTPATSVDVATS